MRNDATYRTGGDPALLVPLESAARDKSGAEVAFARAGIRRVAYPALDNARTIASAEKPTSNAPFYFNVRRKFASRCRSAWRGSR